MARQVGKKSISEDDRKGALSRIKPAEKYDALSGCDLVIETATEKEEVKRKIFSDLCASLKSDAILATNTSSISITRLASSTDRPERFIGIHFMNPVPLMELVELIRGIATDDATFEASKAFITKLHKTIAVSEDFPAFIVNRILLPMINEAVYTLYEGVGNVEGIDTAMGSILTGFGLGVVEGLTKYFYPEASNTVIFVVMVIVLMFRPAGLFGRER